MLESVFQSFITSNQKLLVLSGAGLSADSGIPTFRDVDGFWTVGSKNYMPEEMSTLAMFRRAPLEVWKWFLYRLGICRTAQPNIGHYAIRDLEVLFGERFRIISQNIDGLHHRAGNSPERIYEIHGTLEVCRCSQDCTSQRYPFPDFVMQKDDWFTEEQIQKLKCPNCSAWLRPHVLWFDECYDEENYKFESTL
ncbi:MAG: RNA polymerase subunit sigma, partial [Bacteroidia bacterium]|nr:RNA polymerase subunit sigma [Bacteroidia bacterium]